MRWELVKLLRVPIDSEIIKNINPAQMIWYASMFNEDREDKFNNDLNMTEYLASFINNEAVRQTREARDKQKIMPEEDFQQLIRDKFGRDLSPESLANATRAPVEDESKKVIVPPKRKGAISIDDLKKYTNLELDEIKYHPNKK